MKLWIVGQYHTLPSGEWDKDKQWEVSGIFDTEQKAVDACRDEGYWVAECTLNYQLPHETIKIGTHGWLPYYPWYDYDLDKWDTGPKIRNRTIIEGGK